MAEHNVFRTVNTLLREFQKDVGLRGDDEDETSAPPPPVTPERVMAGILCQVHGLKSAAGKTLNDRRCAVIQFVEEEEGDEEEGRFQVRMEKEEMSNKTFAIKEQNLRPLTRLSLPMGPSRGQVSTASAQDMENMVTKLCELLVYYKGAGPGNVRGDFQPSDIMLTGYPAMALEQIVGESNFMWFVPVQTENMAGVLALANICLQGEESGTENVLFGLLEGDPMYVDVLIQTMHWTGLILPDGIEADHIQSQYRVCPPTRLTPDQDSKPYTKCMANGPVCLLTEMLNYNFKDALWAAMRQSEFYHLFIQRLLRWIGREALKTLDGRKLGPSARRILTDILPGVAIISYEKNKPISKEVAEKLLAKTSTLTTPASITSSRINEML